MTIELSLRALTAVAWRDRLSPAVYRKARELTDREATRQQKMEAIVDCLHREFLYGHRTDPTSVESVASPELLLTGLAASTVDADDACLLVASLAMSVGIRCRLVAARYGHAWTCWVDYEVGDHWETVDPLRYRPSRDPDDHWSAGPLRSPEGNPDEKVMGPIPGEGSS